MPYLGAVQLATTTLGSSSSSVTFSNIPTKLNGLYLRDLILISSARDTASSPFNQIRLRFNSDSGSNYNIVRMYGTGSSTITESAANQTEAFIFNIETGNSNYSAVISQILDYSATDKHKISLHRGDSPTIGTSATAVRWASTNAISSIYVYVPTGSFVSGSTFSLYATVRKP